MKNILETLEDLDKQQMMLNYLAEAADESGLSEIILQIADNIEQSVDALRQNCNTTGIAAIGDEHE